MLTLKNYAAATWQVAQRDLVPLVDPASEEVVAQAGTAGVDFASVLEHARGVGSPAMAELTFAERGEMLRAASKALRERRDELLEISRRNTGTTTADGAFDVDGATGTLAFYGGLGKALGSTRVLADGDGVALAKGDGFYGRHQLVPKRGAAVLVNAFNFPAWGFAEKAAQAWLAGMPVVVKPATATAWLAFRVAEILIEGRILPEGALQILCGGTGDLLERLRAQDVLAFTGSAETALALRGRPALLAASVAVNIEADSVNAAVLAPDVAPGSPTFDLFVRDVVREVTQKSGQKCTAIRRLVVARSALPAVRAALLAQLGKVVTGNAAEPSVTMGPLATAPQLAAAEEGLAELLSVARAHCGGCRVDGLGAPGGKGYFLPPTLLEVTNAWAAEPIHRREVFAPVATLVPYDGAGAEEAEIVALGGGTLVTAVYSDDADWLAAFARRGAAWTGRLYIGSAESAADSFGSGAALPQLLHGGPGRAGGGAELGGLAGLRLYSQRVALQGAKSRVEAFAG